MNAMKIFILPFRLIFIQENTSVKNVVIGGGKVVNDFTKEELIDILNCCKCAYISGEINPITPLQLKSKIQLMIDNYDKPSTKCPKCSNLRVADGMCWQMGCDYFE